MTEYWDELRQAVIVSTKVTVIPADKRGQQKLKKPLRYSKYN